MVPTQADTPHPLFRPVSRRSATAWSALFLYVELGSMLIRNLILVPIYLRHISFVEYGAWLASASLLTYLSSMDLGLTAVLPQQLASAHGARNLERVGTLMGTGLIVCAAIALGITSLGAALSPFLPRTLDLDPSLRGRLADCLLLGAGSLGVNLLGQSLGAILRALQRPIWPGVASMGADVISITLTLWLLHVGKGLSALPAGLLARGAVLLIANASSLLVVTGGLRLVAPKWSVSEARSLARLSVVQFLARITSQLSSVADPYLIGLFLGTESTAIYVLTVRPVEMARLLTGRLAEAAGPSLAHLGGAADRARIRQVVLVLLEAVIVIGGILTLGALGLDERFMALWVGPGKYAGHLVVALYALWAIVSVLESGLYNVIFGLGDIPTLWRSSRLDTGLRLPLLVLLLRPLGMWAA